MQGGFIGPDVLSLKTRELGCGAGDWEADWAEYSSNHHPRLDTGLSQASAIKESRLVLCSAPSVPQPVEQSRRRPLLGPSPG